MVGLWISGLFKCRTTRLMGAALGIAVTVGLLGALFSFLVSSSATMTSRAISAVPIDWQIELVPSANRGDILNAIHSSPAVKAVSEVDFAKVAGFEAATGGTVQTTGPGKVITFASGYEKIFPKEVRSLVGSTSGALLAQQTAANLHAGPGDFITLKRIGLPSVRVQVAGVVDLPDADSLFQGVGLPPQASPQAPPDNVLVLPQAEWHRIFDEQTTVRQDSTRIQFHVRLAHDQLPTSPTAAYLSVSQSAKNLEAKVAGQALVANNIGSRLEAVRGDSLYAAVLFLFLGVPGLGLAVLLTLAVTRTSFGQRNAELALLRARGASIGKILGLVVAEAVAVAVIGCTLGFLTTQLLMKTMSVVSALDGSSIWIWAAVAVVGFVLSFIAIVVPVWRATNSKTVSMTKRQVNRDQVSWWQRYGVDYIVLALSGLAFWQLASSGYQIVLAPEGVPATSVDYKAFLAPGLFWVGLGLLTIRLSGAIIRRNGRLLRAIIRPFAGVLADVAGSSFSNQSKRLTTGIAMTALAISFAMSTAIFNTTYNAQARVDAELTNGSDITVFGSNAHPASPYLDKLSALPGVTSVVPMQHRFAYVGSDLQDMYGVDPSTIGKATRMSNAYFSGGSAAEILNGLAKTTDGVLVSEETVNDFQLKLGDTINLRLMNASDNQYHAVPFKFVGVAREFPTAPKDSFLVANASYIARMTGTPISEYALIRTNGDAEKVASEVRSALADSPALQIRDIGSVSHIIGSSLTAVDMSSLTKIELTYAIIMAASAAGLMLVLGFADRGRSFVILKVIGATPRQIAGFLWSEGVLISVGGLSFGIVSGVSISWMLVKLLNGVFDPPPEALSIPWTYVMGALATVLISILAATLITIQKSSEQSVLGLREL
jgi:putative ABC transport system permease protein